MYEDAKLEALLDEDSCEMQKKLALTLEVTQQTISYRLKSLGFKSKGIGFHMNLSRETLNADFSHVKCCLPGINERVFASYSHW